MSDLWGGSWSGSAAETPHVCGTGGWTGPKPGDPDLDSALISATPAFGGIDVSWTYPTTNPFAVAHVLLFRSFFNSFETAVQHAVVSGNSYYDKSDATAALEYFYWVQLVSINGTYGAVLGPASAIARPTIEDTLDALNGKINEGMLATTLRSEIGNIEVLGVDLVKEIQDRMAANAALGGVIGDMQQEVDQALTYIRQEIIDRTEGDSALVQQINVIAAAVNDGIAAVADERTARVEGDKALASAITTTQTVLDGNTATGQVGLISKVATVDGKVSEIGALYTAKVSVNGLIGGFGVYNDGKSVEAGFDVDTFWIGRTNENKRRPFIIQGEEVFINQAVINQLTFTKLRDEAGDFVVQNGQIQAKYLKVDSIDLVGTSNFKVKSATAGARMEMDSESIRVYDENGILRVQIGKLA